MTHPHQQQRAARGPHKEVLLQCTQLREGTTPTTSSIAVAVEQAVDREEVLVMGMNQLIGMRSQHLIPVYPLHLQLGSQAHLHHVDKGHISTISE